MPVEVINIVHSYSFSAYWSQGHICQSSWTATWHNFMCDTQYLKCMEQFKIELSDLSLFALKSQETECYQPESPRFSSSCSMLQDKPFWLTQKHPCLFSLSCMFYSLCCYWNSYFFLTFTTKTFTLSNMYFALVAEGTTDDDITEVWYWFSGFCLEIPGNEMLLTCQL